MVHFARFVVVSFLLVALAYLASACGGVAEGSAPELAPVPAEPAPAPTCKSSNTAPGCRDVTSASWAVTCDAVTPAPAVWCTLPDGDSSGKVWCC